MRLRVALVLCLGGACTGSEDRAAPATEAAPAPSAIPTAPAAPRDQPPAGLEKVSIRVLGMT